MVGQIDKRKRSREEDVFCDSTPLSKRINNLHLSNTETSTSTSRHLDRSQYHYSPQQQQAMAAANAIGAAQNHATTANGYNPELSEAENPFYYVKNRLLHELHQERLKRCIV